MFVHVVNMTDGVQWSEASITGSQADLEDVCDGLLCKLWDGLHVSPKIAHSKRAKLGHICMVSAPQSVEDYAIL